MTPLLLALALAGPAGQPVPQLPPPGRPQPLPQPLPPPMAVPQAPVAFTLPDFSRGFAALPGKHQVWFVHPCSKRPVEVCFTLPPGRMKRFEVDDRDIEFEFEKCEVRIEFRKNGTVKVEYDD
jgi:hypothetical protein